jgi:hypothetical protein
VASKSIAAAMLKQKDMTCTKRVWQGYKKASEHKLVERKKSNALLSHLEKESRI